MFDFAQARNFMVEGQIRINDVTDPGIVSAMLELERERFVPEHLKALAYADFPLRAAAEGAPGSNRCLLTPLILAKMIRIAEVRPDDYVLHIGCTTGYGTAILARLAGSVVALESEEALAVEATANLAALDLNNVAVVTGPLLQGYADEGPYDLILIEGAVEEVPDHLAAQLKDNGRLVTMVGSGRTGQGTVFRRAANGLSGFPEFDGAAPALEEFKKKPVFVF